MTAVLQSIIHLGETALVGSRNPLGSLLAVFVIGYSVAAPVVILAKLSPTLQTILVGYLIVFPFFMVAVIHNLVSRHHGKLYAPHDYQVEDNFMALGRERAPAAPQASAVGPPAKLSPQPPAQPDDAFEVVVEEHESNVGCAEQWAPFRALAARAILEAGLRPRDFAQVVPGEDFQMIVNPPSANPEPQLSPGLYITGSEIYYVSRRHRIFLICSATSPTPMMPARALPSDAVILTGRHHEPALRMFAEVAERLEDAEPCAAPTASTVMPRTTAAASSPSRDEYTEFVERLEASARR